MTRATAAGVSGPVLITIAAAGMLAWSWGRWPDPVLDFGRELYVPWQLADGKVLYEDIAYFNGPLSPYFNAFWFRIFGTSLRTLVGVNLAIVAWLLVVLYDLLARLGGRIAATVGGLVFVTVFAFSQLLGAGNYNFVCPYSHELTHGVALALTGLWLLARGNVVGMGFCLGLVLLTKPEVAIAAAAALVPGVVLALRGDAARRRRARAFAAFAAATTAPAVVAAVLLSLVMPVPRAIAAASGAWRWVLRGDLAALGFYRFVLGTDHPARNIALMFAALTAYLVVTAVVAGIGFVGRTPATRRLAWGAAVLLTAVTCTTAWRVQPADWFRPGAPGAWFHAARPLPIVMLVMGAGTLWRFARERRSRDTARTYGLRLTMLAFAAVLLAKMILAARIYHYGFALAMPATLLCVVALVDWLPGWVGRHGGDGRACRAAAVGIVLAGVIVELRVAQFCFAEKTVPVGDGPDGFLADRRGPIVNEALAALATTPANATVTAIPEGVMLNYLARRIDPVPYNEFMPPAFTMFGEVRMQAALEAAPPDYIALVHHDPDEYGVFGRDYGRDIYRWVVEHYRPVALFGAPPLGDRRFGIGLVRREDGSR